MDKGNATLIIDPVIGFSVAFTNNFGYVLYRTVPQSSLESALFEAVQYYGAPLALELRSLKP